MIATIREEWKGGRCLAELTCSHEDDIFKLPTSADGVAPGSTCILTGSSTAIFILGADDVWHLV